VQVHKVEVKFHGII